LGEARADVAEVASGGASASLGRAGARRSSRETVEDRPAWARLRREDGARSSTNAQGRGRRATVDAHHRFVAEALVSPDDVELSNAIVRGGAHGWSLRSEWLE
jgi:hypothetical protein